MICTLLLATLAAVLALWLVTHRPFLIIGWLGVAVVLGGMGWYAMGDLPAQKVLGRLVMPLGLLWLGLLSMAVVSCIDRTWRSAVTMFAASVAVLAGTSPWVACGLMGALEAAVPSRRIEDLPKVQAVFVLGGGTSVATSGEIQGGDSGDRLLVAARWWHAGGTPILVTSGSSIAGLDQEGRDLGAETKRVWMGLGIPERAIRCLPGPRNTAEEIRAIAETARSNGWTRVALLTSGWHLPRAMALAKRCDGFAPIPVGADYHGNRPPFTLLELLPHGRAAMEIHFAMWEFLGRWVGR